MLKCSEKAFAMCPTRHLCGNREEATFTEFSECAAFNKKVDNKPLSNADRIRTTSNEEMARILLDLSRSRLGDFGELYELWCDKKGACVGMTEEEFEEFGCSDEEHMACILRYLDRPAQEGERTVLDIIKGG